MKPRYRLFRRGWGTYYCEDLTTGKQESLHTRERAQANRLVAARNEADGQTAFSRHLARVYWKAGDPAAASRTWQNVMEEFLKLKTGNTRVRWMTAIQDHALEPIRNLVVLETGAHHFLQVLEQGSVSTNVYLRRIHNFALDMDWLPWPVLPRKRWPVAQFRQKRAITWPEHQAIVQREPNTELRTFYEMLWETGGSQSDIALLTADRIDWEHEVLVYVRQKTGTVSRLRLGARLREILQRLPATGPLFPRLAGMHEKHRAKEFRRRCLGLKISGVSLHSYRYAWAERARKAGYPERFALEALGHNSRAVHHAYARRAELTIPSLDQYEQSARALVPVDFQAAEGPDRVRHG